MKLGIIGTSRKKDEKRVPLHPDHFSTVPKGLRQNLVFETGYGERLNTSNADILELGFGVAERDVLLREMDAVLLLKPMPEDFKALRKGAVLLGWPHCLQQPENTQQAIDRKLTVVAMEQMFIRNAAGERVSHPFYKNNEMGGYCGVLHGLNLKCQDGFYGPQKKVVILSFGAVGQGALRALKGRGFTDITVCTQQRKSSAAPEGLENCQFRRIAKEQQLMTVTPDGKKEPLLDLLAEADIIVNAILQDPNDPVMYLKSSETHRLKPGCYILDISCDEGLGFPFSVPTSFAKPLLSIEHLDYYAVDHTPNYLWRAASWEVSKALTPYLEGFLKGPDYWAQTEIFNKAIEVQDGVIKNREIIRFQGRSTSYPHGYIKQIF